MKSIEDRHITFHSSEEQFLKNHSPCILSQLPQNLQGHQAQHHKMPPHLDDASQQD